MIVDLPGTSTSAVNAELLELRDSGGAVALGRVLNLVICLGRSDAEAAIRSANVASRDHPCRVLVLAGGSGRGASRLDAQIRVGGDAGASEVIVLRSSGELVKHQDSLVTPLLLPDSPVVVWWPGAPPADPGAEAPGLIAQRRITDAAAAGRPRQALARLAATHRPGDTDLSWTRLTRWRSLLAAVLDQPPFDPVTSAVVIGASDSPSTELLGAWLRQRLDVPVTMRRTGTGSGVVGVELKRPGSVVALRREAGASVGTLSLTGAPDRTVALARRSDAECLTEELRRLDPDEVFAEALAGCAARPGKTG